MRILVCVKRVPAPGARIVLTADGAAVDTSMLGFTISPHEECAITEAVSIAERTDGEVTVLSLGPAEAEEQLRYAASVGAHRLVLLETGDDETSWDPQRTASAIAACAQQLEARDGLFDLVLFGNESADSAGHQVGVRVAHRCGRPMVGGVKRIEVEASSVTVRRPVDGAEEVYEIPLPAMVAVREGINLPRYPTMKGRLASKRVGVEIIPAFGEPSVLETVRLHHPSDTAPDTVMLGEGPAAAGAIVDLFESVGVV